MCDNAWVFFSGVFIRQEVSNALENPVYRVGGGLGAYLRRLT